MLNRRPELTGIALLTIAVLCLSVPSIAIAGMTRRSRSE